MPTDYSIHEYLMTLYWMSSICLYDAVQYKENVASSRYAKYAVRFCSNGFATDGSINWDVVGRLNAIPQRREPNGLLKHIQDMKCMFEATDERYKYDWNLLTDGLSAEERMEWKHDHCGWRATFYEDARSAYEAVHGAIEVDA